MIGLLSCRPEANAPLTERAQHSAKPAATNAAESARITIGVPSNYEYFLPNRDINVVARIDPPVIAKSVKFYSNDAVIPSTTSDPLRTVYHPPVAGPYFLKARAELDTGDTIESPPVRITVEEPHNNETLNQSGLFLLSIGKEHVGVVIRQPSNGAVLISQQEVRIIADAESAHGTIAKVVLSVDGEVIETRTSRPFEVVWTPHSVGRHVLTAHVLDTLGYQDESNRVEVDVER
jgi:hypothetical protein